MIAPRVFACMVPPALWVPEGSGRLANLADLAADGLSMERRLAKGVNAETEWGRYTLCSSRLEQLVAAMPWTVTSGDGLAFPDGQVAALQMHDDYLAGVAKAFRLKHDVASTARLGATFFPPETLRNHLLGLQALQDIAGLEESLSPRIAFVREVLNRGGAVVDVQDPFSAVQSARPPAVDVPNIHARPFPDVVAEPDEESDSLQGGVNQLRARLTQLIARGGGSINLTNQPHSTITQVLHEFAYTRSRTGEPVWIRITYNDGSEASAFPFCSLTSPEPGAIAQFGGDPLQVALMSMRHLRVDSVSDVAWFRNSEVSKSRTLAETDEFCFRASAKQFQDTRSQGRLLIHLIQTGFQPAVIGFYRALVVELRERQGSPPLAIVPQFFSREGILVREGRPWL